MVSHWSQSIERPPNSSSYLLYSEVYISSSRRPEGTERNEDYFLRFCSSLVILAVASLTVVIGVHIVCLFTIAAQLNLLSIYDLAYRLFGLGFACIGVMCEMEWTESVRTTTLLQFWTSRGLFYSFIALFTLREYGALHESLWLVDLNSAVVFSGNALMLVGILYSLMGLFCLERIRSQKMARYVQMLPREEGSSNFDLSTRTAVYGALQ